MSNHVLKIHLRSKEEDYEFFHRTSTSVRDHGWFAVKTIDFPNLDIEIFSYGRVTKERDYSNNRGQL